MCMCVCVCVREREREREREEEETQASGREMEDIMCFPLIHHKREFSAVLP